MRAALIQLDGSLDAPAEDRGGRAVSLLRAQHGADLVVLPGLWARGAWATDRWTEDAEPLHGPTLAALSGAAADARCHLHGGSILERADDGRLYNTSVLLGPDGALLASYRKVHRFGFD